MYSKLFHYDKCSPQSPDDWPINRCKKDVDQFADIDLPVEIDPTVYVGKITAECWGCPVVICNDCRSDRTCKFIIKQKIHLKIPVTYLVKANVDDPVINCCACPPCDEC